MDVDVVVENGLLAGHASGSKVEIERVEIDDEARYEEIAQALFEALLREHAEAEHVTVQVDEGDERAASLLARWGFVPARRVLGVDVDVLRRDLERRPRGESFGSVHVQTDDLPAVQRAVESFTPLRAGGSEGSVVVPPRSGWTSVYDELADRDPAVLRRLARELSDRLGAVVLALGVEEGAVVRYLLLDRGRLLDEYLSIQEFYGPLPSGEVVALAANPTLVERMTGGDRREVRAAAVHGKRPEDLPAPAETAAALAQAMRIEGAAYGYRDAVGRRRRDRNPRRLNLPSSLDWLRSSEAGRAWLTELPRLVRECADEWSLELGDPFPYAFASLALPAGDAVLKVAFPDRESEHEGDALEAWNGEGAVRLLARDRERHALLLERCVPGTSLRSVAAETALDVMVGLLPRLWLPAGEPFRTLAEEAAWWVSYLPDRWDEAGRQFDRRFVDAAVRALEELAPTQGEQVLLHQDLHADNVLSAQREPWLAIDPKPLLGEREFGVAPLVRSFELGHSRRDVFHRLDRLTAELGLDRERARLWTIGQTVAWSVGSAYPATHIETVGWLLDA